MISAIQYRPQASKYTKKESDVQAEKYRQELITFGLKDEDARAVQIISRADRLDYQVCPQSFSLAIMLKWRQLIAAVVKHITNTAPKKGGILIFLPGVQEIAQCIEAVRAVVGGADVLPLHANLAGDEQRRVFVANPNKWKIVAATNVAEVSISSSRPFHLLIMCGRPPLPLTT